MTIDWKMYTIPSMYIIIKELYCEDGDICGISCNVKNKWNSKGRINKYCLLFLVNCLLLRK